MSEKSRIVDLLRQEWVRLGDLLADLPDGAWSRPALPGWDVHDVVAHLVGTERMLLGDRLPDVPLDRVGGAHVHNEIARTNEIWVADLRGQTHAQLLEDFRAVTAMRLAALDAMEEKDFAAPSWTPVGDATYGRFMEIRIFDSWMHEQDVRMAASVPGNEDGPVAEQALGEVIQALGYIVGKRAGAPNGASVTIRLTGPIVRELHVVVDGRAQVVDALPGPPSAQIALSSWCFLMLAGGRLSPEDQLDRIELSGDTELARRVATHLAFTI